MLLLLLAMPFLHLSSAIASFDATAASLLLRGLAAPAAPRPVLGDGVRLPLAASCNPPPDYVLLHMHRSGGFTYISGDRAAAGCSAYLCPCSICLCLNGLRGREAKVKAGGGGRDPGREACEARSRERKADGCICSGGGSVVVSLLKGSGGRLLQRLRPYYPERARSRLISEAKQGQAWLVLGWETAWEYRVL